MNKTTVVTLNANYLILMNHDVHIHLKDYWKKQKNFICWHFCNLWSENIQMQSKPLPILGEYNYPIWILKCSPIESYPLFCISALLCLSPFHVTHIWDPLKSLIQREHMLFHYTKMFSIFFSNYWMKKSNANIFFKQISMVPQIFFWYLKGCTNCDCTFFQFSPHSSIDHSSSLPPLSSKSPFVLTDFSTSFHHVHPRPLQEHRLLTSQGIQVFSQISIESQRNFWRSHQGNVR